MRFVCKELIVTCPNLVIIHLNKRKGGTQNRVPGKIKRREVDLDPQVSPEEIMSKEVELGCESWTSFALDCSSTAVQWTLSL